MRVSGATPIQLSRARRRADGTLSELGHRALESPGRAWRYRVVVTTELWPSVACTRWIGAPWSRAWEAWACRSQCGLTPWVTPAEALQIGEGYAGKEKRFRT